jgi:hypothetical protein
LLTQKQDRWLRELLLSSSEALAFCKGVIVNNPPPDPLSRLDAVRQEALSAFCPTAPDYEPIVEALLSSVEALLTEKDEETADGDEPTIGHRLLRQRYDAYCSFVRVHGMGRRQEGTGQPAEEKPPAGGNDSRYVEAYSRLCTFTVMALALAQGETARAFVKEQLAWLSKKENQP